MNTYLTDTTIIVDFLRGQKKAIGFIEDQKNIIISSITVSEIYQGVRDKRELNAVNKLLDKFQIIHVNEKTSGLSLELLQKYRLSNNLLILDALIAATAIVNNMTLFTGNIKHFSMIKELKLKKW